MQFSGLKIPIPIIKRGNLLLPDHECVPAPSVKGYESYAHSKILGNFVQS